MRSGEADTRGRARAARAVPGLVRRLLRRAVPDAHSRDPRGDGWAAVIVKLWAPDGILPGDCEWLPAPNFTKHLPAITERI